jgi:hypothetical protein
MWLLDDDIREDEYANVARQLHEGNQADGATHSSA